MADTPDHLVPANQPASFAQGKADLTARPPIPRTLLQKAERESPGHCMPGMNRRSFEEAEGRGRVHPGLDREHRYWYH
jgi:hypothetical protein